MTPTLTEVRAALQNLAAKKGREVEKQIGKSVFTSKGASQRNNEAQLCMFCQI